MMLAIFFFSSRRRHTRYWRDWSSDVCSSDLAAGAEWAAANYGGYLAGALTASWFSGDPRCGVRLSLIGVALTTLAAAWIGGGTAGRPRWGGAPAPPGERRGVEGGEDPRGPRS